MSNTLSCNKFADYGFGSIHFVTPVLQSVSDVWKYRFLEYFLDIFRCAPGLGEVVVSAGRHQLFPFVVVESDNEIELLAVQAVPLYESGDCLDVRCGHSGDFRHLVEDRLRNDVEIPTAFVYDIQAASFGKPFVVQVEILYDFPILSVFFVAC